MAEWSVFLLGGSAGAGKSTSGTEAARRLGVACVSADSVWHALQAVTSRESHPPLHYFEPTEDEWRQGPDFLCARHIKSALAQTPALDAFLDREMKEGHRLLFEGAWITPEMAARRCAEVPGTRAAFIYEPEQEEVLASMMTRSGRDAPVRTAAETVRHGVAVRQLATGRRSEPRPAGGGRATARNTC